MTSEGVCTSISPLLQRYVHDLLRQASRIVVGTGWGMVDAAGLPMDEEAFIENFGPLYEAGLTSYEEVEAALTIEDERFWGYWFRRLKELRFCKSMSMAYEYLMAMLKGRDYAILTTTVDGMFYRSGAEEDRLYPVQGNLARLHCSAGCSNKTYPVLTKMRRALSKIDPETLVLPKDNWPYCPRCGAVLVPNIAQMPNFCMGPYEDGAKRVSHYLHDTETGPLLLIEIGVGYGAPELIRFPFEMLTASREDVHLIRINDNYPLCTEENRSKTICIGMDAFAALRDLWLR